MARYTLLSNGFIYDSERRETTPPDPTLHAWREYLAWRGAGNMPDAGPPSSAPPDELHPA